MPAFVVQNMTTTYDISGSVVHEFEHVLCLASFLGSTRSLYLVAAFKGSPGMRLFKHDQP